MFPSPPRHEPARAAPAPAPAADDDDSHLPKGGCRYILLHPEAKGLRCACVGFARSRAVPGSTCDCGHQACYHMPEKERVSSAELEELEVLRAKIEVLEEALHRERGGGSGGLVDRLGRLEELVERGREETEGEFRNLYRQQSSLFHHLGLLHKRAPYYDDKIEGLLDSVEGLRNHVTEIDDASMRLEDKVDSLLPRDPALISRRRKASTPPSRHDAIELSVKSDDMSPRPSPSPSPSESRSPPSRAGRDEGARRVPMSGAQSWTVHVSLLPTSSQPFPFEKDTAAYKRCLSRGLHQVVVVPDTDSASFREAVNEAFCSILQGRPWHPLVARLCDAKKLQGLPMLRRLDDGLMGSDYDAPFLQRHCAVNDESGKILDLYIAMAEDTLSWAELRHVAPYKPGLEAAWTYDPLLDGPADVEPRPPDTGRPAAGDLLTAWSPTSLKRNASEMTRAASFGSSDAENARAKLRRHCADGSVEVRGRHAEAV